MNLAFIASKEVVTYGEYRFTSLQNILYDELKNAIISGTTLVIPSHRLTRQCGKTMVINKLAEEFNLPIIRAGSHMRCGMNIDNMQVRTVMELRGRVLNQTTVLVDEHLNDSQFERWTRDIPRLSNVVGIGEITVPKNGDIISVSKRIKEEKDRIDRIIGGIDFARQNTKSFNQRLYEGFFREIQSDWRSDSESRESC